MKSIARFVIVILFVLIGYNAYSEIKILDFDKTVKGVKFKGLTKENVPNDNTGYGRSGHWYNMIDTPRVLIKGFQNDWSKENAFVFDLYSPKATGKKIYMALYSENPDSESHDYYKFGFRVTWKGWKSFVVPFYSFKKVREPIGFNKIDYIKIAANWGHEDADAVTELYFDNIRVAKALEIPGIFGDNMVIQANKPIKIWGKATFGEKINVVLYSDKTKLRKKVVAGKNGKWKVVFKSLKAGGPYTLKIKGNTTVVYNNIYIGDVWLCGGQSNMYFQLYKSLRGKEEIEKANYPNLRLFQVKRALSLKPIDTVSGQWEECSPETVKNFSAVAYYYANSLLNKLGEKKHIGLVMDCWGGTSAEAWMSKDAIVKNKKLSKVAGMMIDGFNNFDSIMEEYKKWDKIRREYKKKGITDKAQLPMKQPRKPHKIPTVLFNAMINPILNFNIKGVIWYQGESNANSKTVHLYYDLFSGLIKDWRSKWGYNFPFYFVQLPNYRARKNSAVEMNSKWALIRDAQLKTLKTVKNTGMAVTIDLGEADNIHPHNKKPVGYRLSLWALSKTYGKKLVYSGPIYKKYKIKGNKIVIYFEPYSIGKGLMAKGGRLKGFAIAGANRKFKKAKAVIKGNTIVVSSSKVKKPVAVRYAWLSNPECNLYNKNGLPASPFRTDDWVKDGRKKISVKEDWGE